MLNLLYNLFQQINLNEVNVMKKLLMILIFVLFPVICNANSYKIAYVEGGYFWIFNETLNTIKKTIDGKGLSDVILIPDDLFFSGDWDNSVLLENHIIDIFTRTDEYDLLLVVGSDATKYALQHNNGNIPILSIAVSDPIESGFIVDIHDSGIDNFTMHIFPMIYKSMFNVFHSVTNFNKLGIMHLGTDSSYIHSNIKDAIEISNERGFGFIEYNKLTDSSIEDCLTGLKYLVEEKEIDAFFITSLVCFDWSVNDVSVLYEYLYDNNIYTFARNGDNDVKRGALMGFSAVDYIRGSDFITNMIIDILINNEKPRDIIMVETQKNQISFNLEVARRIGFKPNFSILSASDKIYNQIKNE